jgi:hypothetical protein
MQFAGVLADPYLNGGRRIRVWAEGDVPIVQFSHVGVPADRAVSDETLLVQGLPRMREGC